MSQEISQKQIPLQTIIFFGASGSGKGSQGKLLKDFLEENDTRKILHLETGQRFREFLNHSGYVAQKASDLTRGGHLQPEFLSVWNWTTALVEELEYNMHLILDGSPRQPEEPRVLATALDFLERNPVHVIYLELSDDVIRERLRHRGRPDDQNEEAIERRITWFKENIKEKILPHYQNNERYIFHTISGEGGLDAIHQNILQALGL